MYHSITFGDKNTWDDWHLMSPTRPYFVQPKPITNFVEVPGSNGALDFSEALTGYPTYNMREGTFEFIVMNGYKNWVDSCSDIANYINGREMEAWLEDDPDYFYKGRFSFEWESTHPWSTVRIGYTVEPFKWSKITSTDGWLWDPFVFATDTTWVSPFDSIQVDSDNWTELTFKPEAFGAAPVSPTFITNSPMDMKYQNISLGIQREEHLPKGKSYFPGLIFYGYSDYKLYVKGHGKLSMDFRYGRL